MKSLTAALVAGALLGAAGETQDPGLRILGAASFQVPSEVGVVTFSPDSRHLAAGTHKDGIIVWDLETRKEALRVPAKGVVTDLRYWGDGHLVFMTMDYETKTSGTYIWDLKKAEAVRQFPGENYYGKLALSPDGKVLVTPDRRERPSVLAWDLATGKMLPGLEEVARVAKDVTYRVSEMAFSPDGSRIACVDSWSGASNGAKFDQRRRFSVWDWKGAKLLHEWIAPNETFGWSNQVSWMPEGDQLLLSGGKQSHIVNAADGTVVRKFEGACVLSPDRTRIFSYAEGKALTFDLQSGEKKDAFPVAPLKYVWGATLSPDGRWLAAANMTQTVGLVDLREKKSLAPERDGHQRQPYGVWYASDGRLLVFDGALTRAYDDVSGRGLSRFANGFYYNGGDNRLAFDGRVMLVRGGSGGQAELWDTVRGELLGKLKAGAGGGGVQETYLSSDAAWAATIRERSGTLQFHDLKTGELLGKLVGPQHSFFGRTMHVNSVHWSRDGDRVYVGCANGAWYHGEKPKNPGVPDLLSFTGCFDPAQGKLIYQFETPDEKPIENAETLDVHAASDLVYVAGTTFHGLWTASTGKFVREVEKPGPRARFSPDGRWLVSADAIVDVKTGTEVRKFEFGKRRVLSPSATLVAALDDGPVIDFHDVRTGASVARRDVSASKLAGKIQALVWHPAETQVALVLEKQAAILQVDLYKQVEAPIGIPDAAALARKVDLLGSDTPAERDRAADDLTAMGPASHEALRQRLDREKGRKDSAVGRRIVHVLERQARENELRSKALLRELASKDDEGPAQGAKDAELRLEAWGRARELRQKHEKAEPMRLPWK